MKSLCMLYMIAAGTIGSTGVLAHPEYNYNAAADPCSGNRMRACKDDDTCVWTIKPRNPTIGKKEQNNYGHHSGPADKKGGSCAARHIYDRVNHMSKSDKQDMLEKHSLNSEWSKVQCEEAFFLKDCKDVTQQGINTCGWSCEAGCAAADGVSHYENCEPPEPEAPACTEGGGESISKNLAWDGPDFFMETHALANGWLTATDGCCLMEAYMLAQPDGIVSSHPLGPGNSAFQDYDMGKICDSTNFDWDSTFLGTPIGLDETTFGDNGNPTISTICTNVCARNPTSLPKILNPP